MRIIILIFTFFISLTGFSQNRTTVTKKSYMSLKQYKGKYKKQLTKKDSTNFVFKDGDTLVLLQNYVKPKGTSVPYEYKDSIFLHHYKKVAFKHKKNRFDKKTQMKYWKNDVKIFFSKSVSKKTRKELMLYAKSLSRDIDSLNIYQVNKVEKSNYIIYYFGDYEYEPRMKYYKNTDYYLHWKNSQIFRATLKLDPNRFTNEKLRQNQLKSYFLKSLGHFKFSNEFGCDSYFSDCYNENKKMTSLDMELLKYHYSYGICKGTSLETFEEQHKRAKKLLKQNNSKMLFFHLDQ